MTSFSMDLTHPSNRPHDRCAVLVATPLDNEAVVTAWANVHDGD
jgi:hypothetical protein